MGVRDRLRRLEDEAAHEECPPAEEWPIEEWTQAQLEGCPGPALYYIEYKSIEDALAEHLEFHAITLHFNLCVRCPGI